MCGLFRGIDGKKKVKGSPGINTSATCGAWEAGEGGQPHAGVPAFAVFDGTGAGSGSEVEGDDVYLVGLLS